jgi:hypothetical protein
MDTSWWTHTMWSNQAQAVVGIHACGVGCCVRDHSRPAQPTPLGAKKPATGAGRKAKAPFGARALGFVFLLGRGDFGNTRFLVTVTDKALRKILPASFLLLLIRRVPNNRRGSGSLVDRKVSVGL